MLTKLRQTKATHLIFSAILAITLITISFLLIGDYQLTTYSINDICFNYYKCNRIQLDFSESKTLFRTRTVSIKLYKLNSDSQQKNQIIFEKDIENTDISTKLDIPKDTGEYELIVTQINFVGQKKSREFPFTVEQAYVECIMDPNYWGNQIGQRIGTSYYSFTAPTNWDYRKITVDGNGTKIGEKALIEISPEKKVEANKIGFTLKIYDKLDELPNYGDEQSLNSWIEKSYSPLRQSEYITEITFGIRDYEGIEVRKFSDSEVITPYSIVYYQQDGVIFEFTSYIPDDTSELVPTEYDYLEVFYNILTTIEVQTNTTATC